jgi:predicted ATPase
MDRFVVISGCSGGGKSTLLEELARRGHAVVPEPGRRIVAQELAGRGTALPWVSMEAFARRAIELALADRDAAETQEGWVFFDRGLVDAAAALEHATGQVAGPLPRYHRRVFMAPPWPEIWCRDDERRHGFDEAAAEYARLCTVYDRLGYDRVTLPRLGVEARADFVVAHLHMSSADRTVASFE